MQTIAEKESKIFEILKEKFGYRNTMQAPKLQKIVVAAKTGSIKDKNKVEVIIDRLARITGQKPKANVAKKSIATFKLREGSIIGYSVTLRGKRMQDFLDKLIHVALPRTRDFRGLNVTAIDEMGNYTIGIKEHTIFPETSDEELSNVFGIGVTLVTSAKTKEEAEAFLRELGLPLKK
ncbi:50S ribosomal protein L5 [bacterium]|nr:50S ribosomal protein L5 [bacterium]|tara:strand:+ start:30912 stop:31445 length:534 start_codon:yes stop_codon:yes gene_type:complete